MKRKEKILDFIFKKTKSIEAVEPMVSGDYQCVHCGKQLYKDNRNYLTLKGQVYVGDTSKLIGEPDKETKICYSCFQTAIENAKEMVANEIFTKMSDLQYLLDGLDQVNETKVNFPEFLSQDK